MMDFIIPSWVLVLLLVLVSGASLEVAMVNFNTCGIRNEQSITYWLPTLIGLWGTATIFIIIVIVWGT
jgi:hypothetical protein